MEECLRAEVERVVYTSSAAVVGPAGARQDRRRDAAVHRRRARHPVRQLGPRGRGRGDARRGPRAAAGVREPRRSASAPATTCSPRPGWCARSCSAASRSTPTARSRVVDVRDVAEGHLLADRRGQAGRALHPRRAQLHLRAPVRRPRPALRASTRRCGCRRRRPGRRGVLASAGRAWPLTPLEVRAASNWWTYRSTKAGASWAGAPDSVLTFRRICRFLKYIVFVVRSPNGTCLFELCGVHHVKGGSAKRLEYNRSKIKLDDNEESIRGSNTSRKAWHIRSGTRQIVRLTRTRRKTFSFISSTTQSNNRGSSAAWRIIESRSYIWFERGHSPRCLCP